jgi:PAS domain S-box-containing protein
MSTHSAEKPPQYEGSSINSEAQIQKLVEVISRSQQNYRELIDHLDQAVFTISLEGEIRVANLHMSRLLGAPFQGLIGHRLDEFIETPAIADAQRALPNLLKHATWSGTVPVRFRNEQGLRYFSCWLQTVVEQDQASIIGWARDITLQRESELRFTELFERLHEGILIGTHEGRIIDVNPALVQLLGYDSKEELLQRNFSEMYDDPSIRPAMVEKLETSGGLQDNEIVLRRKDGKRVHCLSSGFVTRDAAGRPVHLQGTFVDITERMEMEKRLRREQEFVRRLIDGFPDLIMVIDPEGRFTFVSERMTDILGISPSAYLGKKIGQRVSREDARKMNEMCRSVVSGRESHAQIEIQVQHADGSWRLLRVTASPLFDENGAITGVVSSGRDVTEARSVEQQLARKEKFAAIGQMLAGAAHELNNPLTAILGVADLLRERAADASAARQVELILQQARRAAAIVQNLLALSRSPLPSRARIQIDQLVKQALQNRHASLSEKKIAVKCECEPDLPWIGGDPRQLLQVFLNIIVNSEQSISAARERGTLEVSIRRVANQVRLTFADDGPGISAENLGRIFDPFFTTRRPGGSSGLGLTICLAVLKEHGGTIEVQSTLGAGATFDLFLPIGASEEQSSTEERPRTEKHSAAPAFEVLSGHSVLVVEDEESIREIVHEGLTSRGMKVHAVESSEGALTYLAENSCDAILCDYNLPGLNGERFLEKLRAQSGRSPQHFIFMTGDVFDPAVKEALRAQGVAVLHKPFHMKAVFSLLAELLQAQPSGVG